MIAAANALRAAAAIIDKFDFTEVKKMAELSPMMKQYFEIKKGLRRYYPYVSSRRFL